MTEAQILREALENIARHWEAIIKSQTLLKMNTTYRIATEALEKAKKLTEKPPGKRPG